MRLKTDIVGKVMLGFSAVSLAVSLLSAHPLLVFPACVLLLLIYFLFWTKNVLRPLFFSLLYMWIQVSALPFYSVFFGGSVYDHSAFPENILTAHTASVVFVGLLAIGLWIPMRGVDIPLTSLFEEARHLRPQRLFLLYLAVFLLPTLLYPVRGLIPGSRQLLGTVVFLKWMVFFILVLTVTARSAGRYYLLTIVVMEVVLGLFSFFSSFKVVLFLLIISTAGVISFNVRQYSRFLIPIAILLYLMLLWADVKGPYRSYLNQGERTQAVLVDRGDAMAHLTELVLSNPVPSPDSVHNTWLRASYIDFLSAAMSHVPSQVPHQRGELTTASIMHFLTPRMFFPDKRILDDSADLTYYTGRYASGLESGNSIGMGFATYYYVDFGHFGMLLAGLFMGICVGLLYRLLLVTAHSHLIAWATLCCTFLAFHRYETSLPKTYGTIVIFFLSMSLLYQRVLPFLLRWCAHRRRDRMSSGSSDLRLGASPSSPPHARRLLQEGS